MNARVTVPKIANSIRRFVCCFLVGISLVPVAWSQKKPAGSKEGITLLPTDLREWTATDGRTTKARLLAVDSAKKLITMELENGKKLENVPMAKFSEADQKFMASCRAQYRAGTEVTRVAKEDPAMTAAIAEARRTFSQAYQEIKKDRQRPKPAFEGVMIKAAFRDPEPETKPDETKSTEAAVEHMWVTEITFDGKVIKGILASPPDNLTSIKQDDEVTVELSDLSDWTYIAKGKIFGGFTEKLLHKRMSPEEKKEHNEATGLDWDAP